MDTSIEGFFQKRKLNTKNFNTLIFAMSEKKDVEGAENAWQKMGDLQIPKNSRTYVSLIMVYAKTGNLEKAVQAFDEGVKKFGRTNYLYNALLSSYCRNSTPSDMIMVFRDMKAQGLVPNQVNYTTLIQGLNMSGELDMAWEIYNEYKAKKLPVDEVLGTLMMKICAKTGDAEKALKMFNEIRGDGYQYTTCYPYNSLIRAFASRDDYSDQGIEVFDHMIYKGVKPDPDSFKALFLATARSGNIKKAFNGLIMMKEKGFQLDKFHFYGLIKTYAGACKTEGVEEKMMDAFVSDAWNLFKKAKEAGQADVHVLNSLLEVHVESGKIEMIEGSVLPMFTDMAIRKNERSIQLILKGYEEAKQYPKILRIYDRLNDNMAIFNHPALNTLLKSFTEVKDVEKILEVLDVFLEREEEPTWDNLNRLGTAGRLPDQLHAVLMKFERKGFIVRQKKFQFDSVGLKDYQRFSNKSIGETRKITKKKGVRFSLDGENKRKKYGRNDKGDRRYKNKYKDDEF